MSRFRGFFAVQPRDDRDQRRDPHPFEPGKKEEGGE